MKILHISDTHLGYSAYRKIANDNINQREKDNYISFKKVIDYALDSNPDIILHSGDLFDSVRPNNRAITIAIKQILRLSKNNIPFLIISGNHEQPKLKETGHIFSVFDHIENVYPVYNLKYEKYDFKIGDKNLTIHAIPQTITKENYIEELNKININNSSDFNILVLHGSLKGIKEFIMNEFNELIIPYKYLNKNFDYIALGHYHKYTKISKNCQYAGSTEHFSFSEAEDDKGFIEIHLEKNNINTKFIKIENRGIIDVEAIVCDNLNLDQIMDSIENKINKINPKDKIIRIKLEKIPTSIYRGIDFEKIKNLCRDATHYEIKANILNENNEKILMNSKMEVLTKEYSNFIKDQNLKDEKLLLELGINYIEKIESKKRINDT
jgi:DNA repair exonuclease SbcCD nuclease subunit